MESASKAVKFRETKVIMPQIQWAFSIKILNVFIVFHNDHDYTKLQKEECKLHINFCCVIM